MTAGARSFLTAIKALFNQPKRNVDVLIGYGSAAEEAFNYFTKDLILNETTSINVDHLYYIGKKYIKTGYYDTVNVTKEEWVRREPTEGEAISGMRYRKYDRVEYTEKEKRYVDTGGKYKDEIYKVEIIEIDIFHRPLKFYCKNNFKVKKVFNNNCKFRPFYVKTFDGMTYVSEEELEID